jgi:hypothetical protein
MVLGIIMETLEFVIYPDGRVQEKVSGIIGCSCAEVTAAIEAKLGLVLKQENTSEYFSQHQALETFVTNNAQDSSTSNW